MKKLKITTKKKKQVLDITENLHVLIPKNSDGVCHVHIAHTTACLATADLDPGTDQDMLDAFENMIPNLDFRHPHDPSHVKDHINSTIIGNSVSVPFSNGELIVGTWQRVVLIELNGPRDRNLVVNFF